MIDLRSISKGSTVAILLRHGEREEIRPDDFGNEVALTRRGMQSALDLGRLLTKYNVKKIYTSPLKRCVQTAECVLQGLSKSIEIVPTKMLGNPGFHIADAALAGPSYLKYGGEGVFERFRNDSILEGLATKDYLKTEAMSFIREHTEPEGITLFITHDAAIAHFTLANGIRDYGKDGEWVDYLDGCIIDFSSNDNNK